MKDEKEKNNEPGEKENAAKAAWRSPGTSKVINSYQYHDCACGLSNYGSTIVIILHTLLQSREIALLQT